MKQPQKGLSTSIRVQLEKYTMCQQVQVLLTFAEATYQQVRGAITMQDLSEQHYAPKCMFRYCNNMWTKGLQTLAICISGKPPP